MLVSPAEADAASDVSEAVAVPTDVAVTCSPVAPDPIVSGAPLKKFVTPATLMLVAPAAAAPLSVARGAAPSRYCLASLYAARKVTDVAGAAGAAENTPKYGRPPTSRP